MNRLFVARVLSLGLLVVVVVLAVSACGGGEKKAEARPLPEEPKALRPGTYRSEEFKPSLSFHVGPTWKESEGLNSSERYVPGRRAFGSSGRGRASAFFSPPPQALTAKTTTTTRSPRLRTRATNRRFIYHSYCATYP